eukprot:4292482-Prymnesium_polylepis.1
MDRHNTKGRRRITECTRSAEHAVCGARGTARQAVARRSDGQATIMRATGCDERGCSAGRQCSRGVVTDQPA